MSQPNRHFDLPTAVEDALSQAIELLDVPLLALDVSDDPPNLSWINRGAETLLERGRRSWGWSDATTTRLASELSAAITLDETTHPSHDRSPRELETSLELEAGFHVPVRFAVAATEDSNHRYVVELLDVDPNRRTTAALREVEERFEQIVETLAISVWILKERKIIYGNPASAELLSIEHSRLIGIDFTEFCLPEDVPLFLRNLERVERGETVEPYEYRVLTREGRQLIVEFSSVALDYDGEQAVLSFGRDVTVRKRIEQSRLQADRLSALGLLTGGMAHALNNPLTYVVLNLDHVLHRLADFNRDPNELPDVIARLEEAKEGAERMATIVKRMRSFARTDESTTKLLDLRHVLESVVELIGHEVRHRGKLSTHFEDVPQVIANESKLEQVFLGLLLFAAQVLPDDAPSRPAVRLSLAMDERRLAILEIVCEGCTLDTSRIERLFDPFALNEDAQSQGFGLSLCKNIVEQLGGQLTAEPLIGTGLLLRMSIPCVSVARSSDIAVPSRPPSSVPQIHRGRARLLLIDDDPNVGQALHRLLEGEHDVKCFESPHAALQELLADPSYDLVFCDLMMPQLSGMDLYEVLRYNRPGYEAKLVFMTGDASSPSVARFLSQVPNQHIEKPFHLSILHRLLQRALQKRG